VADVALAHRHHQPIEVAAAADRGASVPAWLAGCLACLALRADLMALASAAPSAAIPRRIRDLRLSPGNAAPLRSPARWWTLDWLGKSRDRVSRPIALGLTTIGLVGLLLTAIPLANPGSAGASDAGPALAAAPSAGTVAGAAARAHVEVRSSTTSADGGSSRTAQALLSAIAGSGGLALFVLRHAARRRGSIR
jgi:hypothetical protein